MSELLHPEAFDRVPIVGSQYQALLEQRVQEVMSATVNLPDQDTTLLIRTRNHGHRLEGLFEDVDKLSTTANIQTVVVDTESSDNTVDIARAHGATVVPIEQADFNYARSLNVGFEAADNPWVVTLVGHSRLSNTQQLRGVTRWAGDEKVAGVYGAAVPDINATVGDVAISLLQRNDRRLAPAEVHSEWRSGSMVAHRSAVRRSAWEAVGGYDVRYGNGGEDTDFARRLTAAGYNLVREPVESVHHSYGLTLIGTARHVRKLQSLRTAEPRSFDQGLHAYRKDMRQV